VGWEHMRPTGQGAQPHMPAVRKLIVFTDLDGTLLDHRDYSFGAASDALARIEQAGVPLVLCSSKTRVEIERLRKLLANVHPFIVENGAAVFIPPGYFPFVVPGAVKREGYLVLEFGRPYEEVVDLLHRTAADLGLTIVGFSDMSAQEIADACGLSLVDAQLARLREYDEPFRLVAGGSRSRDRLSRALRRAGLQCVRGGRFDHATGCADKGTSVAALREVYRRVDANVLTVGLGDSMNDLPLLREVEIPVIVRNPASAAAAQLRRHLRTARVTRLTGPAGWSEVVKRILTEQGVDPSSVSRAPGVEGSQGGHRRRGAAAGVGDV
jgi:mannosyl-3-phosphoglycerate phosphatase